MSIKRSIEKNLPEIRTLITGKMPKFIYDAGEAAFRDNELPVFVFHQVVPEYFEKQLQYIKSNNYRTLSADDLEREIRSSPNNERTIGLTFDDAVWSFWAYAFPLLQKYEMQAILFVSPGITSDDSTEYPSLKDVWDGRCSLEDIVERGREQPLCTWKELTEMHQSGNVDVQSHSMTHALVPVSNSIEGFISPGFKAGSFGNVRVPISSLDDPRNPERLITPGAPLFKSAPRLGPTRRFIEEPELINALTEYIKENGGDDYFNKAGWEKDLKKVVKKWPSDGMGRFESPREMETAICWELEESKKLLEKKLKKRIQHFCYPWFIGSEIADRLAHKAGYSALHYGVDIANSHNDVSMRIRRISEEYLFRLPGEGRQSLLSVWKNKVQRAGNLNVTK
jgi:peptidoglycan/xylan/chitin deacetylase (PgdA/CDA1 family)